MLVSTVRERKAIEFTPHDRRFTLTGMINHRSRGGSLRTMGASVRPSSAVPERGVQIPILRHKVSRDQRLLEAEVQRAYP
jgi:hypothetical protein